MTSIRGVAERSLLTSITRKDQKRRLRELQAIQDPLKRVGALAIHQFTVRHPDMIGHMLGIDQPNSHATVIGSGCDSIVYRIEDTVFKVHKESIGATHQRKERIAAKKRRLHGLLHTALPSITVEQETRVTAHPAFDDLSVTVTSQEYRSGTRRLHLFLGKSDAVDKSVLRNLADRGHVAQLAQLIEGTQVLHANGLVPDVVGAGNLLMDRDGILLIDGLPISSERGAGMRSLARIGNLSDAIEKVVS